MHLTYLDSNSWLIELDDQRILLDPWLVGDLVFGGAGWFFRGYRKQARDLPEGIDLILLSQGLEDHAHPDTLKALDKTIPVVASPNGAKVASQAGFAQVTAIAHGESFVLGDRLRIQAVPGSPIGPMLTENGYLLTGLTTGIRLYYEPHGNHSDQLQSEAPVDVAITPLVNLELPLVGPFIKGQDSALQLATWLTPKVMLPTAAGGEVQFDGVLTSVLKASGTVAEFQTMLRDRQLPTRVIDPVPGERFAVDLVDLNVSP
ncbi:MAG: MBL fold metallo-hydrolase [Kaiparowitsia implicata GSE-PSE-MK54-09C]|jgi:L-ascorbate metabolism protein UlaG (beta-lactamase superfamily)|nr:MBL fold metallo-hydrolase [Kaiparowitsia implicata GSE-PSE-MK54-09C]